MKLTEAKLKQMIAEALKNKRLQDFGIPTRDDELRAKLGDEKFDKIQSLDKQQADMMKQAFDPNYPRDLNRETFASLLEPYGFEQRINRTILDNGYLGSYRFETYEGESKSFYVRYKVIYSRLPGHRDKKPYIEYSIEIADYNAGDVYLRDRAYIEIPDMFELDVRNDEDVQTIISLIINRTGDQIIKAIEAK